MKVKKIVLCTLPQEGELFFFSTPPYFLKDAVNCPPLGLLYLAAQEKDKQVKLIDASSLKLTIKETIERILQEKPDVLGFTAYTIRLYALKKICEEVKKVLKDSIRIVVGGNHTSIYPQETLNYAVIDYVLKGESDYTFPQLINAIDNGEKESDLSAINGLYYYNKFKELEVNNFTEPQFDLNELPFPDRSLLDIDLYSTLAQDTSIMTTMVSSRGCPFKCIFCDVQNKKIRFRSAENVFAEIKSITELGINEISFFDDCFNLDRERVIRLCRLIVRDRLKIKWSCRLRVHPLDEEMAEFMVQSGCNRLHFGVESVNDDILKVTQKGITFEQSRNALAICRKYKINTLIYLIFGFPGETIKDLKNAQDIILNELRPNFIFPNILFPLPGSKWYYELLTKGVIKDDFWLRFVRDPDPDFKIPAFRPAGEEEMLIDFVNSLNRKFYFSPGFIFGNFNKIIKKDNLFKAASAGFQMLFNRRLAAKH